MTTLQAFHEDTDRETDDDEMLHEQQSEAPRPAEAAVAPLPVQPAPVPSCLLAGDGMRLVAGLTWETASGPETPVLRRNAPSVLRLPDRRARLENAEGGRCASLLLAMAAELTTAHCPEASGPWAFIAELPEQDAAPAIWMGLADIAPPREDDAGSGEGVSGYVTPRPGPELMFDDPDDALEALRAHLEITDIAGLAVQWLPGRESRRGVLIAGIAELAETLPLHDVEAGAAAERLPVFVLPRRVPVGLLGALAAGGGAVLAGFFVVLPMIEAAFRPAPPPPPETVSVHVAHHAFANTCAAALDVWWPRVTGWRVSSAGCAMAGYLPETPVLAEPRSSDLTVRPMVVWRHFVRDGRRNQVMADSAADQMIASWPHESGIDESGLTLWAEHALPLVPEETDSTGDRTDMGEARARLAALWADAPNAVTRPADRTRDGDVIMIGAPGATTAAAMFSRAARVSGIAPVRLVQSADGEAVLVLAPVRTREVPAALFEATEGEGSG